MATLIVGDEPCTIPKIVNIMSKSPSFSVLCTNWLRFARILGVPEVSILELKNNLRLGVITLEGLIVDLLYIWTGRCGDDAILEVLSKSLTACNSKDIADKLESEFAKADILATGDFSVQGHVIKMSDIFATTDDLTPGIVKQFRKNEPIQILNKFQIPKRPIYYIERSLSSRTQLNTDVFDSDISDDVFVLENLEWDNLDDKLFGSKVEQSSTQTVRVTAKFIILDFENDYEQICQVVPSDTPVHLVRFDNGRYNWVRSRGSLALIQEHVSSEQDEWSEQEFINNILSNFENIPVCIADTPGMGKTLLLASVAQRVQESCHDRLVLFLVLRELEQSINPHEANHFWKLFTTSDFAAKVLQRMVHSGKFKFELFFDGYDEVLPNQLESVNQFLLSLKQFENIRIHVTTRPHMRNHLEEALGVLSYMILPFTVDNQVDFLKRFWINCGEQLDDSRLESFAKDCLVMLKTNMNDQERDIAGIPLQCALLAEVYTYDALKYSNEGSSRADVICKVESIFQMFQQLIRKKMERIEGLDEGRKQKLLNAHVFEAVKLIFPRWVNKMLCIQMGLLNSVWRRVVARLLKHFVAPHSSYGGSVLAKLYAVGLMEPRSQDAGGRFVHQTFAEFLIAEHLVKHLECAPCSRLLLDVVLGDLVFSNDEFIFRFYKDPLKSLPYDTFDESLLMTNSKFSHNVIAYFMNAHLHAFGNTLQTASLKPSQNVDEMLSACCLDNYPNIFHLLSKVVSSKSLRSTAWARLVLLAARYSDNNLMEQLIQLMQRVEGKNLSKLEFPKEHFGFPVTPLHVAVQRGSFSITRYLVVDQIFPSLELLPYLLHSCVLCSFNDSDAIVKEKIKIIKYLVSKRKEMVHERHPCSNATPLLLSYVHEDLVHTLIEQGVDVNAVDSVGDTVLHMICKSGFGFQPLTPAGYTKIFNLLQSRDFNLWDSKNSDKETPLYAAVRGIEVEESVLEQYSQLKVNFNHVVIDKYGYEYSVLFAAISAGRTGSFINKLVQLGANVNFISRKGESAALNQKGESALNQKGESALHIAVERMNYDVCSYLVTEKKFAHLNHRDCQGRTPLHLAVLHRTPELDAIQALLIDNGAELQDPDYNFPTPLHYALVVGHGLSLDIVRKMVAKGLGSEHLALALDPLVRYGYIWAEEKRSEYSKLFRYLYERGGRIQIAIEKLEQHKQELKKANVINYQLLEQLGVTTSNKEVVVNGIHSATDLYDRIISGDIQLEPVMLALLESNQLRAFKAIAEVLRL